MMHKRFELTFWDRLRMQWDSFIDLHLVHALLSRRKLGSYRCAMDANGRRYLLTITPIEECLDINGETSHTFDGLVGTEDRGA